MFVITEQLVSIAMSSVHHFEMTEYWAEIVQQRPINVEVEVKAPTLDEARALIAVDFVQAHKSWKINAPKKAVSRSGIAEIQGRVQEYP